MRNPLLDRVPFLAPLLVVLILSGCGRSPKQDAEEVSQIPGIPAEVIEDVLEAHYAGLGHMERYEYAEAASRFREIRRLAPDWQPAKINLAIALLNQTGEAIADEEPTSEGDGEPELSRFDEAILLLDEVLANDPGNLHAHYCKGIILEQVGRWQEAHEEFSAVVEGDPNDAHALYWYAVTMPDASGTERAALFEPQKLVEPLEKALAINPYLVPAIYNLSRVYVRPEVGRRDDWERLNDRKNRLDPQRGEPPPGIGDTAAKVYGEMGHYAEIVGPPLDREPRIPEAPAPEFSAMTPAQVELPEGHRWVSAEDFAEGPLAVVGRARARFGAGVAAADFDRDGKIDLFATSAVVGPEGVRDALLLNQGGGRFVESAVAFGIPADRASIGVAVADFDADFFPDLYLAGVGPNLLLRNSGDGRFEDLTSSTNTGGGDAVTITARWLDLDLDGDLDLFVVNHCPVSEADSAFSPEGAAGTAVVVYRNDGRPVPLETGTPLSFAPLAVEGPKANAVAGLEIAFSEWGDVIAPRGDEAPLAAVAALDIDSDRDLDLVIAADGQPLLVALNDRLGQFHTEELPAENVPPRIAGLLVADLDQDGRPDLVATRSEGGVVAWRNTTEGRGATLSLQTEPWPIDAKGWRSASVADLDLDGFPDLMATSIAGSELPSWARNEGDRFASRALPTAPPEGSPAAIVGGAVVDLIGESPLPDLVLLRDGEPPMLGENLGNGQRWLGIDLAGRWNIYPELMRTNPHGIGAKVSLEGEGLSVHYHHTTTEAGPAQSVAPVVLGLGDSELVPLIRLRWPDGVMQTELNQAANVAITLAEKNRKTGSCPVLFTWNGRRFVCFGDFLGGGGMGYLVAPGVYSQPDRDEMLHLTDEHLKEQGGVYRIAITEPMDEVAYLDHLVLDVIDRPPGVESHPDERFSPGGNRPTGALIAWREAISPERATDLGGADVTETLASWDRATVDTFKRHVRWVGYAEEHGIVLDFGDRLSRFGPSDSLVLCLAGWVEYPYSQTNYAAATAGVSLQPPVLERQREDGSWEVIEPDPGYPAGLPRMTTLDLTGKLTGPRCVLRLRTTMECYWDQAFIAVRDRKAEQEIRVTSVPVARAKLGPRGYTREVSPDGRLPLLYDYDYIDPAPLAPFAGRLTRFGDVKELLSADDDRHCLVGPGDEVKVEFDAEAPALPDGWTRSFVLRTYGYCKDADPFTAGSDSVEPLPWKGMPEYPFPDGTERPSDPEYLEYLETYQTRIAGGD
ncbi:FG-GAP-like repeat-containing protein [Tautonia sociabilis]|uniref:Cytochrome c biogenesis factor n=1 Tax=Tautonia sociabilis TaxID=2080755 RepID=A0A432MNK9_9BACT|nr:FG-GAP-like repeat-containing protein [Tautonia sociabilis]RUL89024.1 cytochrome c biogenesis factor [Tautonia sociabilis]